MDHTFDTPDPIELYAEIGRGRIDITAADTDTTTVTVTGEHAEEVVVEQRDGQVAVVAPRSTGFLGGGGRRYLVTVTVPIGSALALKTGSADTRAEGEYGATWANTGSGDLYVELVDRPPRGPGRQRRPEDRRGPRRGPDQERLRRRPDRRGRGAADAWPPAAAT